LPRPYAPGRPSTPAGATYQATEAQYEEAVTAAVAAFEETRVLPAYERGRALREISAGIKARREELARLLSLEAGKPIRDALVEVDRASLTFRLGAEEAIIVYRRTRERMPAHDFEVEEALDEGVLMKWLSTIKHVEGGKLVVERMELDETGFP